MDRTDAPPFDQDERAWRYDESALEVRWLDDSPDLDAPSGADIREVDAPGPRRPLDPRWPAMGPAEIFEPRPPIEYLIGPLDICAGAPSLVAGYGYSGKTICLQAAALSIAFGEPVWGSFAARKGRVLHLDYEQGERLTSVRYQRLAAAKLITPDELGDRLTLVSFPQWTLDSGRAERTLKTKCEGFDLVLVDSLRASAPTLDENDSSVRGILDMLNRVSQATGAAFIVIHHARKPVGNGRDRNAGGARMAIRGSGAIFDACSSVLVLEGEKGEPVRVVHEKARNSGVVAPDFLLRIEDAEVGNDTRGGLLVSAEGCPAAGGDNRAVQAAKDKIRAYLAQQGPAFSATALREKLAIGRTPFFAALAELEGTGEVVNDGTERRPRLVLREAH